MQADRYREIYTWIVEQVRAGQPADVLTRAMCDRGWSHDMAMALIAQAMRSGQGDGSAPPPAADSVDREPSVDAVPDGLQRATQMPAPNLDGRPLYLDLGDRRVSVLSVHENPQIVLFGDFLSKQECDRLIEAARMRLRRSMTADLKTGADQIDTIRTSRGMFFERGENPTLVAVEARIARMLNWPIERGEGMQVLHYRPGERYQPHYDYFNPLEPGAPTLLARGGQRRATLLMYLREPERGGETTFPHLGLRFAAKRGCALFFSYDRPHAATRTLHGGDPVQTGEKWVATKWLREREFV